MKLPVPLLVTCPVPLITLFSVKASLRLKLKLALSTMLLLFAIDPLAAPSPMTKLPLFTVVMPLYVFVAVSVNTPDPFCDTFPLPLITLAKLTASLRLKMRFALLMMLALDAIDPFAVPSPTIKVPEEIVVLPVKVLFFNNVKFPIPA